MTRHKFWNCEDS